MPRGDGLEGLVSARSHANVTALATASRLAKLLSKPERPRDNGWCTMRKTLTVLTVAAAIAVVVTPAAADGARRASRDYSAYAIGAISRNVITPYYVGYYGGHYSYYAPGPYPRYFSVPGCWRWVDGYRIWVC
jgi:uncharacterized membrane protein